MFKNELDKKLNAKLKLFDEIDNLIVNSDSNQISFQIDQENITDNISLPIKSIKESVISNKSTINENDGKSPKPLSNNHINLFKNKPTSISRNKKPQKFLTKEDINLSRFTNNKESSNIKSSRNQLKPKDRSNSKNSFDIIKKNSSSNIGENLYFKGVEMKKKIYNEIETKKNRSRSGTPEINQKSKQIIINSLGVFDRLYPFNGEINVSKKISGNSSERMYTRKISNYEHFNFKPKINNKSLHLAYKNNTSKERLYNLKKVYITNNKSLDKSVSFSKSFSKSNFYSISKDKGINFFEKEEFIKKKKDKNKNEKVKDEENNLRNLPLRPSHSRSKSKETNTTYNNNNIFNRQKEWKHLINKRNEKLRELNIKREHSNCTFKPNIEPLNLVDDEKFINRNLNKMIEYVNKRQSVLKQNQEKEKNSNKKINQGENLNMKPSQFKENDLSAKRNNISPKFGNDILKISESYKTQNYFENTHFSTSYLKKMNNKY